MDRGRPGFKRHLLVDGDGLPLSVILTGASVHDSKIYKELLEGIEPIRTPSGLPRRWPDKIHADKGNDFPRCRKTLRQWGIEARIARRGVDSSERLGRHRWVVQRIYSWIEQNRRMSKGYERLSASGEAFVYAAMIRLMTRRLSHV